MCSAYNVHKPIRFPIYRGQQIAACKLAFTSYVHLALATIDDLALRRPSVPSAFASTQSRPPTILHFPVH